MPQQAMLPVTIVEAEPSISQAKSKRPGLPDVVPIPHATVVRQSAIEIELAGATVRFGDHADLATVRAVLRMLRA